MIEQGTVTSLSGKTVPLSADTLCLHGDQAGAAEFAQRLHQAFEQSGVRVQAV